jgi:putative protease
MEKEVGTIIHFYPKIMVAVVKVSDSLKVGETIRIAGHTTDFTQTVDSLQIEHQQVQEVPKGETVGLRVAERVREGDKVYRVTE